jgi:hypothetical protein
VRTIAAALALVCVLGACSADSTAPLENGDAAEQAPTTNPDADSDNLLNMAYGAAVVSRTGELTLESSAAHAIDGIELTEWSSPPGPVEETLVFSLLAPSRIERVGVTSPDEDRRPHRVHFEASDDNRSWRPLATLDVQAVKERQLVDVPGTPVARYIRVRLEAKGRYRINARAIHALGQEVEPPQTPAFSGCWTINGRPARVTQNLARITGVIDANPPIHLDGGTDNRVALVRWTQGPNWGYAALTRSRDGRHLTALRFYEDVGNFHLADGWFGETCTSPLNAAVGSDPTLAFNAAAGRPYPLFGLAFDEQEQLIDALSEPQLADLLPMIRGRSVRMTAYELREDTPERNRQRATARLGSLRAALQKRGVDVSRIEFVAAGPDWKGAPIQSALQRLLACRIDVEFSGT